MSVYGRGQPEISPSERKKPKTGLIVGIIIGVVILIIIIIVVILFIRSRSSSSSTGTSSGAKCTADSQCLFPNKKCNLTTGNCVGCLVSSDCSAPTKVCNSSNKCVQCLNNSDCTAPAVCVSSTCCDNTPPTINSLNVSLNNPPDISGSYSFSQSIANSTQVVRVFDKNNNLLYTQPANSNLGNIFITQAETKSVIFPNTIYNIDVSVQNSTCGNTAFSTKKSINTGTCSNYPTSPAPTSVVATSTANTPQSTTGNKPGISIHMTVNAGDPGFNAFELMDPLLFGLIVYKPSGLEPNDAQMLVVNLQAQNTVIASNIQFDIGSPWQGLSPSVGDTLFFKFWFEHPSCNSPLSQEYTTTVVN